METHQRNVVLDPAGLRFVASLIEAAVLLICDERATQAEKPVANFSKRTRQLKCNDRDCSKHRNTQRRDHNEFLAAQSAHALIIQESPIGITKHDRGA